VTKQYPRNLAASVRQRLMNLARTRHEDFQFVLTRYALERLLYRLSQSEHRDVFVLKGAMLFQLWSKQHQEYEGLRLSIECRLENARIPIQVDIGFGDVVTPAASERAS